MLYYREIVRQREVLNGIGEHDADDDQTSSNTHPIERSKHCAAIRTAEAAPSFSIVPNSVQEPLLSIQHKAHQYGILFVVYNLKLGLSAALNDVQLDTLLTDLEVRNFDSSLVLLTWT